MLIRVYSTHTAGEEVPVVDVSPLYQGSGSGELVERNYLTPFTSSVAFITDFEDLPDETPGQLYAYRISNTSVVLGTRSAVSADYTIEFAIGLSTVAEGTYLCKVENFANGNSSSMVTIEVVESKLFCLLL